MAPPITSSNRSSSTTSGCGCAGCLSTRRRLRNRRGFAGPWKAPLPTGVCSAKVQPCSQCGLRSPEPVRVDIRIIASTNRDLAKEVEVGRFRCDLFYRLNVVHIALSPLREHREDIPSLADHFVREFNRKLARRVRSIDRDALRALMAYPWKGNVRELEHVIESAMILSDGE